MTKTTLIIFFIVLDVFGEWCFVQAFVLTLHVFFW